MSNRAREYQTADLSPFKGDVDPLPAERLAEIIATSREWLGLGNVFPEGILGADEVLALAEEVKRLRPPAPAQPKKVTPAQLLELLRGGSMETVELISFGDFEFPSREDGIKSVTLGPGLVDLSQMGRFRGGRLVRG
jgi:hypothetical protein